MSEAHAAMRVLCLLVFIWLTVPYSLFYNTGNGHKNIVYWLEIINTSMSVDKEASIPIWLTFTVLNMIKEYQEISVHMGVNLLNICLQTLCLSYTSHMILSVFTDTLLITGHCL